MENTFQSKVKAILKKYDINTFHWKLEIAKEITTLHSSELSKRDELIEAYKELVADIDLHKGTTITEVKIRAKISELTKELK